jgi:hypothetical protein
VASGIPAVLSWIVAKKPKRRWIKTVDEEFTLAKPRKGAKLRREVWQTEDREVVRYSLAYINHRICGRDNGRVLGYDNSHDGHHRHFMGSVEPVELDSYEAIVEQFEDELTQIWRKEDEEAKR